MMSNLLEQLENLSRREKVIMTLTALTVVFYITFTYVFESAYKDIMKYRDARDEIKVRYEKLEGVRGKLKELSAELKGLKEELEGIEKKEISFKESLKARYQIGKVLQTLQTTAREAPIQLVSLGAETTVISKKQEYELENGADISGKNNRKPKGMVQLNFTRNRISLVYKSDFVSTVEFINRILELPYALSILSVDMGMGGKKKEGLLGALPSVKGLKNKKDPRMIASSIDMEIYFR